MLKMAYELGVKMALEEAGMAKVAISMVDLRKASGALRKKVIRATRSVSEQGHDPHAIEGVLRKSKKGVTGDYGWHTLIDRKQGNPIYATGDMMAGQKSMLDAGRREAQRHMKRTEGILGKGLTNEQRVVYLEGASDPKVQQQLESWKKLTGVEREAAQRLALLHEGAEGRAAGRIKDRFWRVPAGHASPSVLIEESNAVASLPSELNRVRDFYKQMRGKAGQGHALKDIQSAYPQFEYGTKRTPRRVKKYVEDQLVRPRSPWHEPVTQQ